MKNFAQKTGVVPECEEDANNLVATEAEEDLYERIEALLPAGHEHDADSA
eukprot:SAG31_NODE_18589_length_630_cov_1.139360_2_plen_49_part_01